MPIIGWLFYENFMKKFHPTVLSVLVMCATSAQAEQTQQISGVQSLSDVHSVAHEQHDWAVLPALIEQPAVSDVVRQLPMGDTVEDRIGLLLMERRWDELSALLEQYRLHTGYDPILYDYAMGAMLRSQAKHNQAIKHYEKITQDPALIFPKFDLAVMYFENKQYRDAKQAFESVYVHLPAPMQQIANQYLTAIKRIQQPVPSIDANIEQTDNVNNASELKEIDIGGLTFVRTEDSLPQSATGLRYNLGIEREQSVGGRHHLYSSLSGGGVYYPNHRAYDEFDLRGELGYRYKDIRTTAGFVPFVAQNWLDGDQYTSQIGATASINHRMNASWQVSMSATHSQKRYEDDDLGKRYDGYANDGVVMALYRPSQHWLYYAGLESRHERLQDESESSNRQGMRLGVTYANDKVGVQTMLRYTQREFLAPNFWYGKVRNDTEMQFTGTVWHNKLNYKGFVPKLNYRHQHTDSNLDLYDRRSGAWFVTVDKMF